MSLRIGAKRAKTQVAFLTWDLEFRTWDFALGGDLCLGSFDQDCTVLVLAAHSRTSHFAFVIWELQLGLASPNCNSQITNAKCEVRECAASTSTVQS